MKIKEKNDIIIAYRKHIREDELTMIELLEKGYMHISFSGIINDITGLTDKIPANKLISWFTELFFDPGKNSYTEQSFSKTDKYMFLKKPSKK